MRNQALWIVGEPGAGKTTLARTLIEGIPQLYRKPKWTVSGNVALAGHYQGGAFDGADTIPYNGAEAALIFWNEFLKVKVRLTVFDGDRFSNQNSLSRVFAMSPAIQQLCVLVAPPRTVAAARRKERGTAQNLAWVNGRNTKSLRFYKLFAADHGLILCKGSLVEQARQLRQWLTSRGTEL
jgi:ABC-type dipeptide/oligopeptide/nickel transport system ATPase component